MPAARELSSGTSAEAAYAAPKGKTSLAAGNKTSGRSLKSSTRA